MVSVPVCKSFCMCDLLMCCVFILGAVLGDSGVCGVGDGVEESGEKGG